MPFLFRSSKVRHIIVHFHFFKNAGTSVETILRAHFGRDFLAYEHGGAAETFPATVLTALLEGRKSLKAVSSHTICFPPPVRDGWKVYPLLFLRHPLDRILSMYHFEKNQDSDSPGARIARSGGPAAYVAERMRNPGERTLRNYQAWMLAQQATASGDEDGLASAAAGIVDELPVVGVVDRFDKSIELMNDWLAPVFPGLDMAPEHRNRSKLSGLGMEERLQRLREALGDELFVRVEHENRVDMALYRQACDKLDQT